MTASELSLFSIEILGLVGRDGAGPHDLLRMAKQGRRGWKRCATTRARRSRSRP
ncbi:MAG TPA: hypothetical protein VH231_03455 [Solirubrobacteraceae bacterium]|nr:hypothetical protein [Solirubrobacteraceae bacterium]